MSAHAIKSSNQSLSNAISSSLSPLVKQSDPLILLRQQQATLETSLAALNFWKPMSFEPLSGPKAVTAFVVFEDGGPQMRVMVKDWLAKIGESYQVSRIQASSEQKLIFLNRIYDWALIILVLWVLLWRE